MQAADGGGGAPAAGAAAGVGAGIVAGMDSLGKQMADFAASAKAGQFEVNDQGGKALLGAIQDMQRWLDDQDVTLERLKRTGEYGGTHGAGVVEPYMNDVASDNQGLVPMLQKFRNVLNDAEEAIKKAMDNYKQTDAGNASSMPST